MQRTAKIRFDVVTIGAATRDVFVQSKQFERIPSDSAPDGWNACLPLGAKIPIDTPVFETGGGATNAAITFARFGCKTACVTRVGNDTGGHEIIARLKKERIDTRGVQRDPKHRTGYSFILIAGTGQRAILSARGASSHLDRHAIAWSRLTSRWIYLTSVARDLAMLKPIFLHAKRRLTRIAWNPGKGEIELGLKKLFPLLLQTDVLILNVEEAAELANCAPRQLDCIIKTLGQLPRAALVVTDGARGAYAHTRDLLWRVSPLKGKVINTTGAGDAFGSGFVASLIQDGKIPMALQVGALNAFSVVRHMGAQVGILKKFPTAAELARVRIRSVS